MSRRKQRLRQMRDAMRAAQELIATLPDQIDRQTKRNMMERLDRGIVNARRLLTRSR